MAGVPTTPPKTRTASLQSLVRQAAGDEWHEKEDVYKFSNGKKFKNADESNQAGGIYSDDHEG